MIVNARYAHTNIIARDWRSLAGFYQGVFGCILVPPERNYSGPALAAGTGIPHATLSGVHLRLPGHGPQGPTLEIYRYSQLAESPCPAVNRPGLAHVAFEVIQEADSKLESLE